MLDKIVPSGLPFFNDHLKVVAVKRVRVLTEKPLGVLPGFNALRQCLFFIGSQQAYVVSDTEVILDAIYANAGINHRLHHTLSKLCP
jgi:hypothetical protein